MNMITASAEQIVAVFRETVVTELPQLTLIQAANLRWNRLLRYYQNEASLAGN